MKDYPDLNMFIQEGVGGVAIRKTGPMVIVSPFSSGLTEKEAVWAVRNIYLQVPEKKRNSFSCGPDLVYGEGFGIVIFYPNASHLEAVKQYCLAVAKQYSQFGIVVWNGTNASLLALDGAETPLAPWNNTQDRLEEWCQHLHSGFQVEGTWNRSASYIRMRHAKLQGK